MVWPLVILRPGDGHQIAGLDFYRRAVSGSTEMSRCRGAQLSFDRRTEGVHVLPVLRPPMKNIPVVGGDAQVIALAVADDILLCQAIESAEIHAEVHRFMIDLVQIIGVREIVLADLEGDVGVIADTAGVPTTVIPRQGLIGCHRPIGQLADETMDAGPPDP